MYHECRKAQVVGAVWHKHRKARRWMVGCECHLVGGSLCTKGLHSSYHSGVPQGEKWLEQE